MIKIAQATNPVPTPTPNTPAIQDVRTLQGVKQYLFSTKDWVFINNLVSILSSTIYTLGKGQKVGGHDLNFQTIVLNPSIGTGFTGSAKSIIDIILVLWRFISNDNIINSNPTPFSSDQVLKVIELVNNQIAMSQFTDTASANQKTKLITILNNWKSAT